MGNAQLDQEGNEGHLGLQGVVDLADRSIEAYSRRLPPRSPGGLHPLLKQEGIFSHLPSKGESFVFIQRSAASQRGMKTLS
jgi:hypothetical protein